MTPRRRPRNNPQPVVIQLPDMPLVPDHTHPAPTSTSTSRALAGLGVVFLLFIAYLGYMQYRSDQRQDAIEAYIAESKALRDQQNHDVNARINEAVCAIMDRLPAGALLDPIREDYGCGPGMIAAEVTEEQLAEILRDYGPGTLARTPAELYEFFPPPAQ